MVSSTGLVRVGSSLPPVRTSSTPVDVVDDVALAASGAGKAAAGVTVTELPGAAQRSVAAPPRREIPIVGIIRVYGQEYVVQPR